MFIIYSLLYSHFLLILKEMKTETFQWVLKSSVGLHSLPMAAVTKYHKQNGFKNRNVFSDRREGQKSAPSAGFSPQLLLVLGLEGEELQSSPGVLSPCVHVGLQISPFL